MKLIGMRKYATCDNDREIGAGVRTVAYNCSYPASITQSGLVFFGGGIIAGYVSTIDNSSTYYGY